MLATLVKTNQIGKLAANFFFANLIWPNFRQFNFGQISYDLFLSIPAVRIGAVPLELHPV